MSAINPCLPLSALNDVVRSRTSPTASTASPSDVNRPWLTSAHEVRDRVRGSYSLHFQLRHFGGLPRPHSNHLLALTSCNKWLFELPLPFLWLALSILPWPLALARRQSAARGIFSSSGWLCLKTSVDQQFLNYSFLPLALWTAVPHSKSLKSPFSLGLNLGSLR